MGTGVGQALTAHGASAAVTVVNDRVSTCTHHRQHSLGKCCGVPVYLPPVSGNSTISSARQGFDNLIARLTQWPTAAGEGGTDDIGAAKAAPEAVQEQEGGEGGTDS